MFDRQDMVYVDQQRAYVFGFGQHDLLTDLKQTEQQDRITINKKVMTGMDWSIYYQVTIMKVLFPLTVL